MKMQTPVIPKAPAPSKANNPMAQSPRPLPLHRADLVHGSQLVVDLCDLIREARGLGY